MSTITERVARGAAFLDEHDADWWRADVERAIDLDALCIQDTRTCILGQRCPLELLAATREAAGDEMDMVERYDAYAASLFGVRWASHRLSFLGHDHGFAWVGAQSFDKFDLLTAEWKRVITERRAA